MITTRLLLTTAVNVVAIVVAIFVARHLLRRPAEGEARRATRMFALWWGAFAADTLLNTLTWLAGGLGIANELVTDILSYPALTAIVLMIWGLAYYLAYLFTGRGSLFRPIAIFYALSWIAFLALVIYLRPIGVRMGPYAGEIVYMTQPPPAATLYVAVFFLLPPIIGSVLYGTLAFRVDDPAHRYRILAVSIGIFVWFTSALIFTGVANSGDGVALFGKVLHLACLALFVSAYLPPAWLRRRWSRAEGLDPWARPVEIDDPTARQRRHEALMQRARELV